jgi:hypothetical protein
MESQAAFFRIVQWERDNQRFLSTFTKALIEGALMGGR